MKFIILLIVAVIASIEAGSFKGLNLDACPVINGYRRDFKCIEKLYDAGKFKI